MMPVYVCQEIEGCDCAECVQARAEFDAWVEDTRKRWADPKPKPATVAPSGLLESLASDPAWVFKQVAL